VQGELSTAPVANLDLVVDNSMPKHLLGVSVPKRHARRSVTRSALKRLLRSSFQRHAGRLPPGLWLVRLRSAFPTAQFRSADSSALRQAATIELDLLLGRAAAANASPSPSA